MKGRLVRRFAFLGTLSSLFVLAMTQLALAQEGLEQYTATEVLGEVLTPAPPTAIAPQVVTPPVRAQVLAQTGVESWMLAVAAAILLTVGVVLLARARAARQRDS